MTAACVQLLCEVAGLRHALEHGTLSVSLPNPLNASFSLPLVMAAVMLLYLPLFPPMYLHMFRQRRRVLGGRGKEE